MLWRDRRQSTQVERRGGGIGKGGGISIGAMIVALVLWWGFGIDPSKTLGVASQIQGATPTSVQAPQGELDQLVATVLADTEDVWGQEFAKNKNQYPKPKLVLFTGAVRSGCGNASSASGPFYCPADQTIYLDTQFFADMKQKMDIKGEQGQSELENHRKYVGDFAMAYVIAHEVGHHVQTVLGISNQVRQAQAQNPNLANNLSVRMELQADCFAGLWAQKNHARTGFLGAGDIEEAMDAAEKIGDDYLQKKAQGHAVPDSFTHGTSAQRKHWFDTGFNANQVASCDTFSGAI